MACSKSDAPARSPDPTAATSEPASATQPALAAAADEACSDAADSGFADPQAAFTRYAGALEQGDFCAAIQAFASEARDDVARANFRALALLAGAANPHQAAYRERFKQLCERHRLACATDARAAELAQTVMQGRTLETQLARLAPLSEQEPEALYVEVMGHLASVDPTAMSRFQTPLADVRVEGDRATGSAKQHGGAPSALAFIKTDSGWKLNFE